MALGSGARRDLIADLIRSGEIHSQSQLVSLLASRGVKVTQATASRDLEDIGAYRMKNDGGSLIYVLPRSPMLGAASFGELIVKLESNGNLVVARTPPGGAQLLASVIDQAESAGLLPSVMGTIAGDDTVLIISRIINGGDEVCAQLKAVVQQRP